MELTNEGAFNIKRDGFIVASGTGLFSQVLAEACHYAEMYVTDGPVLVTIWKYATAKGRKKRVGICKIDYRKDIHEHE